MMRRHVATAFKPKIDERTYQAKQKPHVVSNVALTSLLKGFNSHSLADQSIAALMDRVDTKFILPMSSLTKFLSELKDEYTILEQAGRRLFNYETTYFDTPDRFFYRSHHNGQLNRNKVRFRHYRDTNTAFMEVKLKNNKQRTIKKRMPLDAVKPNFENAKQFLKESLHRHVSFLETALFVKYQRVTLMNKDSTERLTLDLSLSFKSLKVASHVRLPQMWIAELKRDRKACASVFLTMVKQQQLNPVNFSKYCIGSALTDSGKLKTNRFKPTLQKIVNLTNIERINTQNNNT
jgi:hypothetical protein